jgi:hypothetical protein
VETHVYRAQFSHKENAFINSVVNTIDDVAANVDNNRLLVMYPGDTWELGGDRWNEHSVAAARSGRTFGWQHSPAWVRWSRSDVADEPASSPSKSVTRLIRVRFDRLRVAPAHSRSPPANGRVHGNVIRCRRVTKPSSSGQRRGETAPASCRARQAELLTVRTISGRSTCWWPEVAVSCSEISWPEKSLSLSIGRTSRNSRWLSGVALRDKSRGVGNAASHRRRQAMARSGRGGA